MSIEQDLEVANIIMSQLGNHNRMRAMIGLNSVCAVEKGVQFKFKGSTKFNSCKIVVNDLDLYVISFHKIPSDAMLFKLGYDEYTKRCEPKLVHDNIYCNSLRDVFESTTGLHLSL